jgi:ribosomal protein S18 acetylase RimI-like enzyme/putative intracellular protease/amidase
MRIAILTFDGFNEIDSFVAAHMLNRMQAHGWQAQITAPAATVTSMNGVQIQAQQPLEFANQADAVLIGSGRRTRAVIEDQSIMQRLSLDPRRQLVGSQCSGALLLARLGMLRGLPACTDASTRPSLQQAGIEVLDRSFFARGNVASAGGCLSAQYLAAWVLWRLGGRDCVEQVCDYVAPVGEHSEWLEHVCAAIGSARTTAEVELLRFHPVHREHFKRLNVAWLERYFKVEPIDEQVLGDPEGVILASGGEILFGRFGNSIVGTVALKREDDTTFELTKMAVDPQWQGRGVGRRLLAAACELAAERGARRVILYSHRSLEAAIALYRQQGFVEQTLDSTRYARSNIKMVREVTSQRPAGCNAQLQETPSF